MKHKGLLVAILIILLLGTAVFAFAKINKYKNSNTNNVSSENPSLGSALQSGEMSNKSNGDETLSTSAVLNTETVFEKNENWENVYLNFVKKEKDIPTFTLTEFEYAFVSIKEFEMPLLLVHDDWNMYLFIQKNSIVQQVCGLNGETLTLSRMDDAYTKDGILYFEGACGSPKAFYLCELIINDRFSLKYLAEGNYTSSGDIVYHDDQGNEVSKETYEGARNNALDKAQKVTFENNTSSLQ